MLRILSCTFWPFVYILWEKYLFSSLAQYLKNQSQFTNHFMAHSRIPIHISKKTTVIGPQSISKVCPQPEALLWTPSFHLGKSEEAWESSGWVRWAQGGQMQRMQGMPVGWEGDLEKDVGPGWSLGLRTPLCCCFTWDHQAILYRVYQCPTSVGSPSPRHPESLSSLQTLGSRDSPFH